MRTPDSLESLLDHGIIQEVVRPLMSGKEAQIYVVMAGGEECVAKVYKEASQRTFKHRAEYTEGRRTLNSRDQRAMGKRSRYGRKQDEAAWRSTEVDIIFRLRDAGVRVPEPHNFIDGVLVMELVRDADGNPAPRLGDLTFTAAEARDLHRKLIREVVRMLCAGIVHGDLSEFNVLMGADGPVLIDFPQSVDPAHNQNARKLLLRDVENLNRFVERSAPRQRRNAYAKEMWALYETNRLTPDTELSGDYRDPAGKANTDEVLALIDDAERDEQARRGATGQDDLERKPRPLRAVVDFTKEIRPRSGVKEKEGRGRTARSDRPASRSAKRPVASKPSPVGEAGAAKKRRPSRRRKRSTESKGPGPSQVSRNDTQSQQPGAADSGAGEGPKRRRRGRRAGARAKPDTADGRGTTVDARPAKKPTASHSNSGGSAATDGAARPTRRRRRRPRARRPAGSDEKGRPDDG